MSTCSWNFMLSWVEHKNSFITSGPDLCTYQYLPPDGYPGDQTAKKSQPMRIRLNTLAGNSKKNYMSLHVRKLPDFVACKQQRRRSSCTSMQSDQHLCYSLYRQYSSPSYSMQNFNALVYVAEHAGLSMTWSRQGPHYMGRNARKPVLWGLPTTKTQTSLHIQTVWSAPLLLAFWKVSYRERSGSVVECLTRDRRATGSSLTGVTVLWSLSKTHLS